MSGAPGAFRLISIGRRRVLVRVAREVVAALDGAGANEEERCFVRATVQRIYLARQDYLGRIERLRRELSEAEEKARSATDLSDDALTGGGDYGQQSY